jgi:hypothetical protein
LSRESFKRGRIDELWKRQAATSPSALVDVLTSDAVAVAIRRELRRQTGQRLDPKNVVRLLKETAIRSDI